MAQRGEWKTDGRMTGLTGRNYSNYMVAAYIFWGHEQCNNRMVNGAATNGTIWNLLVLRWYHTPLNSPLFNLVTLEAGPLIIMRGNITSHVPFIADALQILTPFLYWDTSLTPFWFDPLFEKLQNEDLRLIV